MMFCGAKTVSVLLLVLPAALAQTTLGGLQSDYCIEWLISGGGHIDRTTDQYRLVDNCPGSCEPARGTEPTRKCDADKQVVGCVTVQSTGEVSTFPSFSSHFLLVLSFLSNFSHISLRCLSHFSHNSLSFFLRFTRRIRTSARPRAH